MKERVIEKTLLQQQKDVSNAQLQMKAKLQSALKIDEISNAYNAYSKASFDDMLSGVENSKNTQKAYLSYQKALKNHGFCENDFVYIPHCPICGDSGNDNGKVCKCVWDKYISNLKDECEIDKRAKFSFDDCNFDNVKNDVQKQNMQAVYNKMKVFVGRYPNVKSNTIVFFGGVGTGKTCLASAMCRSIVEKGYATKILSAYEFCSLMLKTHTSPIVERNDLLHDVLTADVLCLDDLGTEPMLKNVTVEYLLLVIEERQNANKLTVITTNLDPDKLHDRYGERIYSRLSHKQQSKYFQFIGTDLRTH